VRLVAVVAGEAVPAVGEVQRFEDDSDGARKHERDQREVKTAQPQGRQQQHGAEDHRDEPGL
jgi:hypothetical protein